MVKSLKICITVLTEYRGVVDRRTDILPLHSPRYAYASRDKNRDFQPISCLISEMIQRYKERAIVIMDCE